MLWPKSKLTERETNAEPLIKYHSLRLTSHLLVNRLHQILHTLETQSFLLTWIHKSIWISCYLSHGQHHYLRSYKIFDLASYPATSPLVKEATLWQKEKWWLAHGLGSSSHITSDICQKLLA